MSSTQSCEFSRTQSSEPSWNQSYKPSSSKSSGPSSSMKSYGATTDEDDHVRTKIHIYDKKIQCLITEIGALSDEMKQPLKIQCPADDDVCGTQKENVRPKRSNECLKGNQSCQKSKTTQGCQEAEGSLISMLMEAEMDGKEAAKEACLLKDAIGRTRHEKPDTCPGPSPVDLQKEKLISKLDNFKETNRCLRQMLREQQGREEKTQRLAEQKDVLLKKLSACDAEKTRLELKLCAKEKEMESVLTELESEKDLARTATDFTKFLECTKDELTKQLKDCEEKNRNLCTQLQELESKGGEQDEERSMVLSELEHLTQRGLRDKEDLQRAACAQKQRADRCEESLQQLQFQIQEKDIQLDSACASIDSLKAKIGKLQCEKARLIQEVDALNIRVQELIEERECLEEKNQAERDCLFEKLHRQCQENNCIKQEYEQLKETVCGIEEKLNAAQAEVQDLKATICQYKALVENYKCQVQQTRREADEICAKLDKCNKDAQHQKDSMNSEVETLKRKFKSRIKELEQLPEMLKSTERKLQECQQQLACFEKKNSELSCMISELRKRVKNWRNSKIEVNNCDSQERLSSCNKSCKEERCRR